MPNNGEFKGRGLLQITGRNMGKTTWAQAAIDRLRDDLGPYNLKFGEYDFSGTKYYVVQPVGWMHAGDNIQWDAMVAWVVETFGPTPKDGIWTSGERWYCNNARFYFKNIKDRDWFVLKWTQ